MSPSPALVSTTSANLEAARLFGGIFVGGIMIFGLGVVFWLIALIDILRSEFKDSSNKVVWLVVALLLPFLGPLLYFIIGRNQAEKGSGISMKAVITAISFFIYFPLGVVLMWLLTKWPIWLKIVLTVTGAILVIISLSTRLWWIL